MWLKRHSSNNGVTCARIYCYVFIYVRMRLRKPRVKWKGYHVEEKYPALLLLFEVISHIGLYVWRDGRSRDFDQNIVASEGEWIGSPDVEIGQLANLEESFDVMPCVEL